MLFLDYMYLGNNNSVKKKPMNIRGRATYDNGQHKKYGKLVGIYATWSTICI